jgi:hypothetical protein
MNDEYRHPAEANKLIEELFTTIPYEWEMYFRLECEVMPRISKALDLLDKLRKWSKDPETRRTPLGLIL